MNKKFNVKSENKKSIDSTGPSDSAFSTLPSEGNEVPSAQSPNRIFKLEVFRHSEGCMEAKPQRDLKMKISFKRDTDLVNKLFKMKAEVKCISKVFI